MNKIIVASVASLASLASLAGVPETPNRVRQDLKWEAAAAGATLTGPAADHWKRVEQQGYLTLDEAFRIALPQSERLARVAEQYHQAASEKDRAVAAILPSVTVQGSQLYQHDTGLAGATSSDRTEWKLSGSQPLFQGFREHAALAGAGHGQDQQRWAFESERRALYRLTAQAFYATLFQTHAVKIFETSVTNARERVREMRARHEQGMARRTEVLLLETQTAADESQWIRTRQAFERAKRDLEFLLGRPLTVTLKDTWVRPTDPGSVEEAVKRAWARRSELRERAAAVKAAEANTGVAGGAHWPSVDLEGNYYGFRRNFSASQQATTWDLQVVLTWPLFRGGDLQAQADQAASAHRAAVWEEAEVRRRIELDVRNAWTEWEAGAQLLETLETRERSARDNYTQVLNEYRQGIAGVTNVEVSIAQNQWLAAQLELDRQRVQHQLDGIAWQMAQGLLPEEGK